MSKSDAPVKPTNFIHQIIEEDLKNNVHGGQVVTRFPPEPNGYLHIGHAKSICLNFGTAVKYNGQCNLRFDDTNPEKESQEYIDSIIRDVNWLGYQWAGDIRYTSSYFDQLYQWAIHLIKEGKAYVCHLSPEQAKEYRGNFSEPGKNSPYRDRSVEENLDLFERMKNGEFKEGECALRAKIDMASPNMNLRDPMIYRILHTSHHQTGDKWCIYPIYDFAHGQSDAIEGVTHSICTLEFEDHRPLYEWFIEHLPVPATPRQYEFSRLELNYTVTSKRKLKQLVDENHVSGWDDHDYQAFRAMVRNPEWQAAFISKPIEERVAIAKALREKSKSMGQQKSSEIMDVNSQSVISTLDDHNAQLMIHGHTHRPAVHELSGGRQRIVLGDWDTSLWYLYQDDKELTLIHEPIDSNAS
jgi:glutaminyl-tRNA synthetase